ncbi:MAG: hypothetical protein ABSC06_02100 [Rhodopila sp.]
MIRPLTIATCLLAFGSGLYLYESKHEVQVLDRTIERTVHDTSALREQSRLLAAEWTMLNDPERLRQFSDTYLRLKTITPSQFTSIADLNSRLPAPRTEAPPRGSDDQDTVPVATETAPGNVLPDQVAAGAVANEDLPVPPIPAARPAMTVAVVAHAMPDRPPIPRPVAADSPARPGVVADGRPFDQRNLDQHPADQHAAARFADARPMQAAPQFRPIILAAPRPPLPANGPVSGPPAITPSRTPVAAAPEPYGGSLLGVAHGSMPPVPRPTPMNAAFNSN